ncbi:divergent PAP2 family protein [Candidatus Gracilibacteria bacterium 28_42_T64]|nr:divergent PAP2 family protein [Candidatus Gracilibacteria bacterium 28_42_T64]
MNQMNFFYENLLIIPFITFFLTVIGKGILIKIKTGKVEISQSFGSGGMPSVHSSVVVSLATAIALKHGIASDYFALAITMTVIIIYDAINVRYEAGLHASAINTLLGKVKFKESLGHLPSEAFAGSMLGIFIATLMYYM